MKAIFALVGFSGLRSQEVCNIKIEDIDLNTGKFEVLAKGDKMALRMMNSPTLTIIKEYLKEEGRNKGYLFVGIARRNRGGQIATSTLRTYLKNVCTAAGISLKGLHGFRRGVADRMNANGATIELIAEWLGHGQNIQTTIRYFRAKQADQRLTEAARFV